MTTPTLLSSDSLSDIQVVPLPSRRTQTTVLLSAFGSIALTIGYNQCYGVFQEYYLSPSQNLFPLSGLDQTQPTALLAFVGTLCYGLTWAGGILINPVISRIEHGSAHCNRFLRVLTTRMITVSGVLLMTLGFALASLSTSVWHLLLTQGLLTGMGMSLVYFPLLAPAPEYFAGRRGVAMGFVSFYSPFHFLPYNVFGIAIWLDQGHMLLVLTE